MPILTAAFFFYDRVAVKLSKHVNFEQIENDDAAQILALEQKMWNRTFFGRDHFAHNSDDALVNVGTSFPVAGIPVFAAAFETFSGILKFYF